MEKKDLTKKNFEFDTAEKMPCSTLGRINLIQI